MDRTLSSKQSDEEFLMIMNIISQKGINVEKRKELNQKVREILPTISNDAIIRLYVYGHQLSFLELRRRFENEILNDLSELIRLFEQLLFVNVGGSEIYNKTLQRALVVSKSSSSFEIAELLRDFGSDRVGDDYDIFEEILSGRDDIEEISNLVNSFNIKQSELDKIIWIINYSKEIKPLLE